MLLLNEKFMPCWCLACAKAVRRCSVHHARPLLSSLTPTFMRENLQIHFSGSMCFAVLSSAAPAMT